MRIFLSTKKCFWIIAGYYINTLEKDLHTKTLNDFAYDIPAPQLKKYGIFQFLIQCCDIFERSVTSTRH